MPALTRKVRFPSAKRLACLCAIACAIAGVVVMGAKLTEPFFARRAEKKLCHSLVDRMLHADDPAERRTAASRLSLRCRVQGRAESRVELVPGEPDARRVDWRYLRVIDDDYVIDAFLHVFEKDHDEALLCRAISGLSFSQAARPEITDILVSIAESDDQSKTVLCSAISGLSFSQAARPEITDILASIAESEDRSETARWAAAEALLWGNGGRKGLEVALELLEGQEDPGDLANFLFLLTVSRWRTDLVGPLRQRMFEQLLELARDSADDSVRAYALAAAAVPGGYPERRDSIINLARSALDTDDSPRVRRQAVFALADWGLDRPEVRELLETTAASDPDPWVRRVASRGVARAIRESAKASQEELF